MTLESVPGFRVGAVASTKLRSGDLARRTGVSSDTLRHYERMGVLARPRRGDNGYRQYEPAALERVVLLRRALAVGFRLEELRRLLASRERGTPPCREVRRLAQEKLKELDARLTQLAELRGLLQRTIRDWDRRLAATPDGKPARLLESLAHEPSPATPSRRRRLSRKE